MSRRGRPLKMILAAAMLGALGCTGSTPRDINYGTDAEASFDAPRPDRRSSDAIDGPDTAETGGGAGAGGNAGTAGADAAGGSAAGAAGGTAGAAGADASTDDAVSDGVGN
jgi:hypothetical protein